MLQFGRTFYNTISNIMSGTEQNKEPNSNLQSEIPERQLPLSMQFYDSDRYQPSLEDVLAVKNILFTLRPDSPLPLELIDAILDLSEYWPHTTSNPGPQGITIHRPIIIRSGNQENQLILRSLPIGYLQDSSNDQSFQMRPEDQVNYTTKPPTPWSQDREVPQDATKEVVKNWTESSQVRGEFPCKKIVFRIKSHDQGWGGAREDKGSYRGSYTWFDVGWERTIATTNGPLPGGPQFHLSKSKSPASGSTNEIVCALQTISPDVQSIPDNSVRDNATDLPNSLTFKHKLNPDQRHLQKNRTATTASQEHTIVWRFDDDIHPESPEADELEAQGRGRETANGEFVRSLRIGDVVTIWAKARYPGWANTVEDVSIDVYWAV
ncbi:hypothetical protein MFRU_010g01150 [Monilinia fructicola]|uniref:Ankyrin repeat protein n=1 Tax=Monilinia fructicola TaxID=38448 RepID=A0A5M9JDV1_MONFR|nr:hypothetical protein EYC84_008234 [Monilinia fructicola]KAG4030989.1 hypothetical protein MFRU_010g01150 [Monilinia fructicola]